MRLSQYGREILLVALAVVLVLGLIASFEMGLRIFLPSIGQKEAIPSLDSRFHPLLGWRPSENNEQYQTDSLGLRRTQFDSDTASPVKKTILFIGDSTTWGDGVHAEEAFPAQLNSLTDEVRILNGGIPGYHTVQEYLFLELLLEDIKPETIILAVYPNDFSGNVPVDSETNRPYATLKDGQLEIVGLKKTVMIRRWLSQMLQKSSIVRLFQSQIERRHSGDSPSENENHGEIPRPEEELKIMKPLLLRFNDLAEQADAQFLVLLLPTRVQFGELPSPSEEYQIPELTALEWAAFYVNLSVEFTPLDTESTRQLEDLYLNSTFPLKEPRFERLVEFGVENNITTIDLTEMLYKRFETLETQEKEAFFYDFHHLGARGHEELAQLLNALLSEMSII